MIAKRALKLYVMALLFLVNPAWNQAGLADEPKGKGTIWDAWSDYKPDQDPGMPNTSKGTESGKPPAEAVIDKSTPANESSQKAPTASPGSAKKDAGARGTKAQARLTKQEVAKIKAASKAPIKTKEPAEKK